MTTKETNASAPAAPLISIIVPIYNEEQLLPEVLREVRKLPLSMELLLVDDHSTDGTPAILSEGSPTPGYSATRRIAARGRQS